LEVEMAALTHSRNVDFVDNESPFVSILWLLRRLWLGVLVNRA
jgi:hypothetical protein